MGMGPVFLLISCIGSGVFFVRQFMTWNPDDKKDCGGKFKVCPEHLLAPLKLQTNRSNEICVVGARILGFSHLGRNAT